MAGQALNSQSIKAWAKTEFAELIFSAILVAIIISLVSGQKGFIESFSPEPFFPTSKAIFPQPSENSNVIEIVEKRINFAMIYPLQEAVLSLSVSSMRLSKLLSFNFNWQWFIPYVNPTGSAAPAAGGMILQSALIMGIDSTALVLFLAQAVKITFVFLSFFSTMIFLPVGILLRFIPPARNIGNLLLAISLSVMLVFPLAVLWSTSLLYSRTTMEIRFPEVPDPGSPGEAVQSFTCSPVMAHITNLGEGIIGDVVHFIICSLLGPFATVPVCLSPTQLPDTDPPLPPTPPISLRQIVGIAVWLFKNLYNLGSSIYLYSIAPSGDDVINNAFTPLVDKILPIVLYRNLSVLLMVVIDLICSIVLMKNIAQALGAEGQLYGISRLI
jgi:hypothetical protein